MSTILITCSNMSDHVRAAQEKEGTDYPVIELDSKLHAEPRDMRARLFETLETLPKDVDLVLLSMGHCGGSVAERPLPVKLVMPKVDDCITLLLHTDDNWYPNLKEGGHLYLTDRVQGDLSIESIHDSLIERYGEKKGGRIFDIWFDSIKLNCKVISVFSSNTPFTTNLLSAFFTFYKYALAFRMSRIRRNTLSAVRAYIPFFSQ